MRYPDGPFADTALDKLDFLVVADLFETATTAKADVVLPMAAWAEQSGSYVNLEGRYQWFDRALPPQPGIKSGKDILRLVAAAMDTPLNGDDDTLRRETKEIVDAWRRVPRDGAVFLDVKQPALIKHDAFPYRLLVGNDLHHYGYLTEHCPSLLRFTPEAYLEMSPNLAGKLGLVEGGLVRIESPTGKLVLKVHLSEFFEGTWCSFPITFPESRSIA